ncbi:MAG: response regulator, partial [Candidatus Marinimicrobia bacterium]|nr:response regulator [Candidatus Neomarinimicrobiota bacterium]
MLDQEHQLNFRITELGDKSKVERIIQTDSPDVILLSSNVKDYPEMKFLRKMRKHDIAPVVMVASDGDEQSAVTAMKIGVYDYIPKSYLTFDHLTKSVVSANEKWRLLKETERL